MRGNIVVRGVPQTQTIGHTLKGKSKVYRSGILFCTASTAIGGMRPGQPRSPPGNHVLSYRHILMTLD